MNYTEKILNHSNKTNELHNIASEAVRKGVLSSFTVNDMDHSDMIGKGLYLGLNMTYHAIELEINNIKSMMENGDKEMKEFELKVGDKVFIREDLKIDHAYGSSTFSESHRVGFFEIDYITKSGNFSLVDGYIKMVYSKEMIDWDKTKELQSKGNEIKELTVEVIQELLDKQIDVELIYLNPISNFEDVFGASQSELSEIRRSKLIVKSVDGNGDIALTDCFYSIPKEAIKYFRIKEPSATFNDLIGIGLKAVKDGVIFSIEVFEDSIFIFTDSKGYDCNKPTYSIIDGSDVDIERTQEVISHIKSLYTETFTIESEDDVNRINLEIAEAELENGKSIPLDIFKGKMDNYYIFCLLKGATITQKKGGK